MIIRMVFIVLVLDVIVHVYMLHCNTKYILIMNSGKTAQKTGKYPKGDHHDRFHQKNVGFWSCAHYSECALALSCEHTHARASGTTCAGDCASKKSSQESRQESSCQKSRSAGQEVRLKHQITLACCGPAHAISTQVIGWSAVAIHITHAAQDIRIEHGHGIGAPQHQHECECHDHFNLNQAA